MALLLFFPKISFAADLCVELQAAEHHGVWAVAPFDCPAGAGDACAELVHQVILCAKNAGNDVITPSGLTTAVDEHALKTVIDSGDTRALRKLGDMVPAKFLATGEVSLGTGERTGAVRLIDISEGKVISAGRVVLRSGKMEAIGTPTDNVEIGLRRLADRLVDALDGATHGSARYQRIAVLDFKEASPLAKQKGMGKLVSAELVTRFAKEHNLVVVERARLDQVLKEYELGQYGALSEKDAPKLGKLVHADAIVLGTVAEAGANFEIYAQIVDTEAGTTLAAEKTEVRAEGMLSLASDALVLRTKSGAAFRSLAIPGWGQFYNRQVNKGIAFMVSVGVLGFSAIGTGIGAEVSIQQYRSAKAGANFDDLVARANGLAVACDVLIVATGLVWAYNVLDAYLNGVTFDSAVASGDSALGLSLGGVGGHF